MPAPPQGSVGSSGPPPMSVGMPPSNIERPSPSGPGSSEESNAPDDKSESGVLFCLSSSCLEKKSSFIRSVYSEKLYALIILYYMTKNY